MGRSPHDTKHCDEDTKAEKQEDLRKANQKKQTRKEGEQKVSWIPLEKLKQRLSFEGHATLPSLAHVPLATGCTVLGLLSPRKISTGLNGE